MKRCVNVDSGRPKLGERGLNLVILQGSMGLFTTFVKVTVNQICLSFVPGVKITMNLQVIAQIFCSDHSNTTI